MVKYLHCLIHFQCYGIILSQPIQRLDHKSFPSEALRMQIMGEKNAVQGVRARKAKGTNLELLIKVEVASVFVFGLVLWLVILLVGAGHDTGFLVVTDPLFEEIRLAGK